MNRVVISSTVDGAGAAMVGRQGACRWGFLVTPVSAKQATNHVDVSVLHGWRVPPLARPTSIKQYCQHV